MSDYSEEFHKWLETHARRTLGVERDQNWSFSIADIHAAFLAGKASRGDVSRQDWEEIPHPDGASDGAAFIVSTGDEPVFCVSVDGKWYRFRMPPIPGALRITLENGTGIETTGYVSDNSPRGE